ncbi:MAG: MlaD family protein [Cyclobacteriaceae bacterium]
MSKEFKVGLLTVVSGLVLYYGFNFLKGVDFFSTTNKYYAVYDNIDGLQVSNPVILNGLAIGRVSKLEFLSGKQNEILVELNVDEVVELGDSAVAMLYNVDFLGSKGIQINNKKVKGNLVTGDTLFSAKEQGLEKILTSSETQIANLGVTIKRVNDILLGMEGSGEEIKASIIALRGTLERINAAVDQNENKMRGAIDDFGSLVTSLKETGNKVEEFLDNANGTVAKINALEIEETLDRFQELAGTLNTTLENFNEGEGTIHQLINDKELYTNLNKTLVSMDSLLDHMNHYPKDFFGPLGRSHKKVMKSLEGGN